MALPLNANGKPVLGPGGKPAQDCGCCSAMFTMMDGMDVLTINGNTGETVWSLIDYNPFGVAVDDTGVYLITNANNTTSTVRKHSLLDGSVIATTTINNVSTVAGGYLASLTSDGSHLYVHNQKRLHKLSCSDLSLATSVDVEGIPLSFSVIHLSPAMRSYIRKGDGKLLLSVLPTSNDVTSVRVYETSDLSLVESEIYVAATNDTHSNPVTYQVISKIVQDLGGGVAPIAKQGPATLRLTPGEASGERIDPTDYDIIVGPDGFVKVDVSGVDFSSNDESGFPDFEFGPTDLGIGASMFVLRVSQTKYVFGGTHLVCIDVDVAGQSYSVVWEREDIEKSAAWLAHIPGNGHWIG